MSVQSGCLIAVTFAGQNYGARKRKRLHLVLLYTLIQVTLVGLAMGWLEILLSEPLSRLYVDMSLPEAPLIVAASVEKINVILSAYFICGIMDVMSGYLRGIGYSLVPMLCCVFGVCGLRAIWVFCVFPLLPQTALSLFISYPISWGIVILMHTCTVLYASREIKKRFE